MHQRCSTRDRQLRWTPKKQLTNGYSGSARWAEGLPPDDCSLPPGCECLAHQQSMVAKGATMLLSSTLGHHVGEAAADTNTVIVGERAAQGRAAARTGHCTGLTG